MKPPAVFLKNISTAPFIYFDAAPCFGLAHGAVEVTLAARTITPRTDNTTEVGGSCVAHLRCTAAAAASLRDALTQALAMIDAETAPPPPEGAQPALAKH